eukprot:9025455-Lingulodinium_polyedra.AAC.1
MKQSDNDTKCIGNLTVLSVPNSDLPGLLGLAALRTNRAVLDFNALQLYFCGPGDYDMDRAMPVGTD